MAAANMVEVCESHNGGWSVAAVTEIHVAVLVTVVAVAGVGL